MFTSPKNSIMNGSERFETQPINRGSIGGDLPPLNPAGKGLVTNYRDGGGGYKTGGGGGHVKFYPYEKGGAEKVLAMLKGGGGGTKSFGVDFTRYLDVLAVLKGGTRKVSTL